MRRRWRRWGRKGGGRGEEGGGEKKKKKKKKKKKGKKNKNKNKKRRRRTTTTTFPKWKYKANLARHLATSRGIKPPKRRRTNKTNMSSLFASRSWGSDVTDPGSKGAIGDAMAAKNFEDFCSFLRSSM